MDQWTDHAILFNDQYASVYDKEGGFFRWMENTFTSEQSFVRAALKKNFKSDVAAANFRMRALEGKSTNKIPEQDQNNSLIQSKNKGNDVGPNIPKISYEILKHNRAYKNKKTDPESGPSANDKKAVGPVIATSTLEATRRKKLERSAQKLNISVDELNRRILAVKMDTSK